MINIFTCANHVRDHLPLQQGLRLSSFSVKEINVGWVRDHLPLQQGLRLMFT